MLGEREGNPSQGKNAWGNSQIEELGLLADEKAKLFGENGKKVLKLQ